MAKAKAKPGRPSDFTTEKGDTICEALIEGKSLRTICVADDMPSAATVCRWLASQPAFREQYALARVAQADTLTDECLDIADDGSNDYVVKKRPDGSEYDVFDSEHVQRSKLRIDQRRWYASKLAPKKYGDAVQLKHADADGDKLTINIKRFTPEPDGT